MTNVFEYELEQYMESNKKYFHPVNWDYIRECIVRSDRSMEEIRSVKLKSPVVAKILAIFGGYIGLDRFYLGNYIFGFIKMVTSGLFIIGWVSDAVLMDKIARTKNEEKLCSFLTGRNIKTKLNSGTVIENLKSEKGRTAIKRLLQSIKNLVNSMS